MNWGAVPCKEWTGNRDAQGYGRKSVGGRKAQRTVRVHREAWVEVYGPIPVGLCVLHHCDNPPCYEVAHLFLGTRTDNAADRESKGRNHQTIKTHCPRNHPFTQENTYIIPSSGARVCRICQRTRNRLKKQQQRKAAA